jgi:hypothetical protein
MYEIFTDDPARGARFGMTMSTVDEKREFLLENYPWESKSSLVDVGGSHGSIPISIVERFSHIKCYVQDLPKVVEEGNARLPEELRDRIEFMAQSVRGRQNVSSITLTHPATSLRSSQYPRMCTISGQLCIIGQTSIASRFLELSFRR